MEEIGVESLVMRVNHVVLRREMKLQRWTVTALAEALEPPIARTHLSNIVHGKRPATAETVKALAEALNLNPYALLGPEDPTEAIRELVALYGLTEDDLFRIDPLPDPLAA